MFIDKILNNKKKIVERIIPYLVGKNVEILNNDELMSSKILNIKHDSTLHHYSIGLHITLENGFKFFSMFYLQGVCPIKIFKFDNGSVLFDTDDIIEILKSNQISLSTYR